MIKGFSSLRAVYWLALTLLVLGLVVRSTIPSGYMLDRADDTNVIQVRLCGAGLGHNLASFNPDTLEWVKLDPADNQEDGHTPEDPASSAHGCEFALSMVADLPEADAFLISEVFGTPLLGGKVYVSSHRPTVTSAPMPARGPPSLI